MHHFWLYADIRKYIYINNFFILSMENCRQNWTVRTQILSILSELNFKMDTVLILL